MTHAEQSCRDYWLSRYVYQRRIDYGRHSWFWREHNRRYCQRAMARHPHLLCQECGGAGEYTEVVDPWLGGPTFQCGWCCGGGYVLPRERGYWLRFKRQAAFEVTGR